MTPPPPHPIHRVQPRRVQPRRARARLAALVAAAGLVLPTSLVVSATVQPTTAAASGTSSAADDGRPSSFTSGGYAATGALFPNGLSQRHTCTASVVRSASHDLLLTAAHCLHGSVTGWSFVPRYMAGAAPYGVWTVSRAYLPSPWLRNRDPGHDYAVLQIARKTVHGHLRGIEDVVGGYRLATGRSGEAMRAPGYNGGRNDRPISCVTRLRFSGRYPTFDCHGYFGGTSGSPWLIQTGPSTREIHGLIGGLHHGGCHDYTSYSSPITADTTALVARAAARRHPDLAPSPGGDGC